MPRQDDGWIDITTGQPASGGPSTTEPYVYQPLTPTATATTGVPVPEDYVSPVDVAESATARAERIIADPAIPEEDKSGLLEDLQRVAAGGPGAASLGPSGNLLGLAGRGIMKALGGLTAGARAVQASIAEPFEALGMIGSGAALDVSSAYGAAAGRGPVPEAEVGVDLSPTPGGSRETFRLPSKEISTRRSWTEKVSDPSYMLTVPNIRDKVKAKTGIGWVDKVLNFGIAAVDGAIELGFQAGTDPLSYITFGSGVWAGQAGRAALTARLLEKDVVAKVPSLLNNPQRIYRLGEWGLTRAERKALVNAGVLDPEGIAWAWGSQAVLAPKVTGPVARAVGGTVARTRAATGDVLSRFGVTQLATTGERRALMAAARDKGWSNVGNSAREAVIQYAGSQAAKRELGITSGVLTSRHRALLQELMESPYRNDIAQVIEPGTVAPRLANPEAQALADRVSAAFDDMRELYNYRMEVFRQKYALNPEYAIDIPSIDNYFYHRVTDQTNRLIRQTKAEDRAPWFSQIQEMVGIGAREMRQGGGPLRMRKLVAGEEWLGEELKTGSIAEINDIWRRKTNSDFDFFETDSASVLSSYIDSISHQAARVAYFDRLFDYGSDAIRPVMEKVVPDKALLGQATKTLNRMVAGRDRTLRSIQAAVGRGQAAGQRLQDIATAVLDDSDAAWAKAEAAVASRQQELAQLGDELVQLRDQAANQTASVRAAFEDAITAAQMRVAALESAIQRGEGAQEAARQYLVEAHVKMFPGRKKRPTDPRQLAAEILDRRENRFASKLKALETRRSRAQKRQASAARRAERLGVEAEEITVGVEDINARTARLRALSEVNFDPDVAPDGVVYTSEEHLLGVQQGQSAVFYSDTTDLVDPVALPAADIEQTYDLVARLDDLQRVVSALDESAAEVVAELTGRQDFADWITVETRRLMQSPLGTDIDPRVPEELAPFIQTIHGFGRVPATNDEVIETYVAEMVDTLEIALQDSATEPLSPEMLIDAVDDIIYGAARIDAGPEAARVMVAIPDVQVGGTKILMDATEAQNIYSGASDSVFAGIKQGSDAWEDVVPQRITLEPVAAPAAAAPTPTAAPAARAAVEATTDDSTREMLRRNMWVANKERTEAINQLIADAKKAAKAGNVDPVIAQLDNITDIGEKAQLVREALDAGTTRTRSPFFREVLERFQYEVEFAVGRAAAGIGTDNFSRAVQQSASADPDLFLRYTVEAAQSAGVRKPEKWAKIPKAERDQLEAAAAGGAPTPTPTAAAAVPEPVAPTTQVTSTPLDAEMRLAEQREQLIARGREVDPELAAATEQAATAQAAAAAAGREIAGLKAGEASARRAVEGRVPTARGRGRVEVDGEQVTIGKAQQLSKQEQSKLRKIESQLDRELKNDPVIKSVPSKEKQVESAATKFEAAEAAFAQQDDWQQSVRPLYEADIQEVQRVMDEAPLSGGAAESASQWATRVNTVLDSLQTAQFTPAQRDAWDRVFTQLFGLEADLALWERNIVMQQSVVDGIANSNIGGQVVKDILDGWVEIERLGVQIPRELFDEMSAGVRKLQNPSDWNAFMRSYLQYQRFFKSYAIATPGFVVRNAMTAAFNNLVAGVSPATQNKVRAFARNYYRNGLEAAFDSLPAGQRAIYEEAYQAVVGSGGGQAIDEIMPLVRRTGANQTKAQRAEVIYNNRYTRWFQKRNERAEIWARMAMAVDGVERGFTLDANTARIKRYHFDYGDTSKLDEVAKLVIPFWTFASRNVSLQIVNQFARPGMYQRYNDLRELTEGRADDYAAWPLWLREREPVQLGTGMFLNPDLPQVDLQQQLEQLFTPRRLLGQSNPLIRTAVEGLSGRSLAFDTPFGSKTSRAGVTDIPSAAITELADLLSADVSGEFVPGEGYQMGRFAQSVAPGLLPPLQQLQRYLKSGLGAAGQGPESPVQQAIGGSERYAERDWLTTLGTYLGIPVGRLTPEQLQAELRRIQYNIRDVGS